MKKVRTKRKEFKRPRIKHLVIETAALGCGGTMRTILLCSGDPS